MTCHFELLIVDFAGIPSFLTLITPLGSLGEARFLLASFGDNIVLGSSLKK
jgi:hypothetical protein